MVNGATLERGIIPFSELGLDRSAPIVTSFTNGLTGKGGFHMAF